MWKYFKLWMRENSQFFKNEPFLVEDSDRGVLYRFKGVTPFLSSWVEEYQYHNRD